jgi:hypothetical protein
VYNVAGYYDRLWEFLQNAQAQDFLTMENLACVQLFTEPDPLLDYMEKMDHS